MAARLLRIDCSASFTPWCRCGWRGGPVPDQDGAQREVDRHRRTAHPGAAKDTEKRRRRRERRTVVEAVTG